MKAVAVIGMQFGDEAKGKVVDVLAASKSVVAGVRYAGGNNAGHTVVFSGGVYKLHHVPSTVFHGKLSVISHGCVVNPKVLGEEISRLGNLAGNVLISRNAHVIMPWHIHEDSLLEERKTSKVGTTGRGIGPCYADKANRIGLQVRDLIDGEKLGQKLDFLVPLKNALLKSAYGWGGTMDREEIFKEYSDYAKILKEHVFDRELPEGTVILEGAQGTFLDMDLGTYPFVTSSNPTIGGALSGAGIGKIDAVIGVMKAYTTRVGEGPFPTELGDETGKRLQLRGKEFGTTTGRPRRVGWLDMPMLKYAVRVNNVSALAVTKLDVLAGLKEIKVAVAHEIGGRTIDAISNAGDLEKSVPVYETLPGWDDFSASTFEALPAEAQAYIKAIEKRLGVPVAIVSVGADRNETILREGMESMLD